MKQIKDYILGQTFNALYWILDKLGVFFVVAPVFTAVNGYLHRKNTRMAKGKISRCVDESTPSAPSVHNRLPNSGGIRCDEEFVGYKVASKKLEASKPSNIREFKGVSIDDALSYKVEWKHYSFYPITEGIRDIAGKYLGKEQYSLLE